uniref:Uncharacterized protein n=1 Tax=Arundo donax TaxID=35708 RepID=A0A0A9GKK5_ARUDO
MRLRAQKAGSTYMLGA